ncbi:MAG: transglycosylase domain-containing protein [Propylenella sp.]
MARREKSRIEPKFAGAVAEGLAVGPDDRAGGWLTAGRSKKKAEKRRAGRKPGRGKRRRRSAIRRLFGGAFYWAFVLCLWAGIAGAGLIAYYAAELPGASEWRVPDRPPNIQIVAVDGQLIGNRGDTGGESVPVAGLPSYVPNAVIAIEDRRFRSHFGVDPVGLARAVARNFFAGGVVEGGSTLTQQLAKNMFLTPERSLKRKVQEVVLSLWLETKFTKDQILEMYLNRVYFGNGAYGIDAAARRYFDVEPAQLTLPQAAVLAGVLPAPSRYAPNRNPEAAAQRASLVLGAMAQEGYITAAQADEARKSPAQGSTYQLSRSGNYIADWVQDVLPFHLGVVEQDIVVETTVDLSLQVVAERTLAEVLDEEGAKYDVSEGGMVVVDGTGAVRAMVGGRSYAASQFNRAVDARRQPGSAFKPFVYLTAVEQLGYRPDTIMIDEPVTFGEWTPHNYDNQYRGPVPLKTALALSINTVAAQLADQVGPEAVVQTAKRLGVNSPLAANPSIALGTSEVTLLELTGAYAPFSNGGYAVLPFVIQRVRTPQGDILFERAGSSPTRVVSLESVALMNDMLQATVAAGTGSRADLPGWPAGGKTGTSQSYRDAWFIGYTANLTAGIWVGNDSNAPTKRASGANIPALIWSKFMIEAHRGVPVAQLPGSDLVPYLLAQPAPGSQFQGWGAFAQASPEEQAANDARMRNCILNRSANCAIEAPSMAQPQRRERRGFFQRLFGG